MTEELTVTTERVDDIPILLAQAKKIDLPELLDSYFRHTATGLGPVWDGRRRCGWHTS